MSVVSTATNQKYLVLIALPTNQSLPFNGMNEADLVSLVEQKVSGNMRAGAFWEEASHGETSFIFDVHSEVLDLPEKTEYYYRSKRAKIVEGSGANFPIDWAGDEILELKGNDSLSVSVMFPAGSMSLTDCLDTINDAIQAASSEPTEPQIIASSNSGQIKLTTRRKADDAKLDVSGSALEKLGLDSTNRTVKDGLDLIEERKTLVQHSLEERVKGLSDNDTVAAVRGYDGIITAIVGNDNDIRAGASTGSEEFPLNGQNFEFSFIAITVDDPWQVFAHEIGHNLSFPDLYQGETSLVGREPGAWDIMGSSNARHPTGWIKTYKTENTWTVDVEVMKPQSGPDPKILEVLLAPTESPLPSSNPFSGTHPNIPFTQVVRLDIEGRDRQNGYQPGNRSLYVENRVKNGTYTTPFDDPDFDTELIWDGVIITDAINTYTGVLVNRSEVRMAEPDSGPILVAGDVATVQRFGTSSSIRVEIVDMIQNNPPVYHIKITWGPGERFDYRIEPWDAPPWESPDIWVDTNFANDWDEYKQSDSSENPNVAGNPILNGDESRPGWVSRVYARVHNDGNVDRTDVPVRFEVVLPAAIGPAPGQLIGEKKIDIPKRSFALARVDWEPRSSNEGHVCLRVIVDPDNDELSVLNNEAQENLTEWYAEASSPYKSVNIKYQVANPLSERAPIRLRAKGLTPGWSLDVDPYEFWLEEGEVMKAEAVLKADERVPFDDILLQEEGLSIPIVSLEGLVLDGHSWVPFGGISGIAHAVRKTDLEVDIELTDSNLIIVFGQATTLTDPEGGPVIGGVVGLRVFIPGGKSIAFARVKTDNDGKFQTEIHVPEFTSHRETLALDAVLAPIVGHGPASAEIIRFTLNRKIDEVPRERFRL